MNKIALEYVQNRLANARLTLESFTKDENGSVYPTRTIFIKIKKYVDDFLFGTSEDRWVIIPGLRGVGKTTLLAQMYLTLLRNQSLSTNRLLYFSLDDAVERVGLTLNDILEAYEYILGGSFEGQKEKIFIFIDEVQSDKKWSITLKTQLYDKTKNIFVLCTGSSAVSLQTNADVYRRANFEKLYPMNFCEYQMIKNKVYPISGLKKKLHDTIFFSDSAEQAYKSIKAIETDILRYWSQINKTEMDEYLTIGTLPFAIKKDEYKVYEKVKLILDRIVDQDIRDLGRLQSDTIQSIKRLLFLLADANDTLSINKLSGHDFLSMNPVTLAHVLDILEKAELLVRVTPHGSTTNKVRKASKYLFMSPTYRMALLSVAGNENTFLTRQGKLIEDVVGEYFYREISSKGKGSLSYDSSQGGADFILEIANSHKIAVEVGRGEKDNKQIGNTMKKITCRYGINISYKNNDLNVEGDILQLPLSIFLLT
ncbi:MAG: ATP-binding protein [Candidatus Pacebacteria bacterium]|nr:ATP-binding protein [Candidatus Paceibacterota bacterium]